MRDEQPKSMKNQ